MKLFTNHIKCCFVISTFLFVSFQISCGLIYGEIHSPVSLEPYDERSAQKLSRELGNLSSYTHNLKVDSKALNDARMAYATNNTPGNYAKLQEAMGKALNSSAKATKNTVSAIDKIMPDLRKYKVYLAKIKSDIENRGPGSVYRANAGNIKEMIKGIDKYLDDFKNIKKLMDNFASVLFDLSKVSYEMGKIAQTGETIFGKGKPEEINLEMENMMKDMKSVVDSVKNHLIDDNSGMFGEEYKKSRESLYNVIDEISNDLEL